MAISAIQQLMNVNAGSVATAGGPLSALYENKNALAETANYPLDLGSSTKNHFVKFSIKQMVPAAVTTDIQGKSLNGNKNSERTLLGVNITPETTLSKAVICLYMPDTLTATYNASYDELSLTNDLGKGVYGLQQIKSVFGGLSGDKSSGAATSTDAAIRNIVSSIAAKTPGLSSQAADVALQGGGFAINPQLQMIYRGVGFREFQLTFLFTPKSQFEAMVVNKIIGTFKYHFAPDLLTPDNAGSGMFLVPPSFFNIEYMFNSTENLYLPKYGDCVLTSVDVNYAPNGFAAHIDGAPIQTQLNLTFKEIEIVTKAKLVTGYNSEKLSSNNAEQGFNNEQGLR